MRVPPIRLVDERDGRPSSVEYSQLLDRLAVSMGRLGRERDDVLEAVAQIQLAQYGEFHQSCASLNYTEAEMIRRDLRGANNPTVAMFVLRLLERPKSMREALAILAQLAGCRLVIDDAAPKRVQETKADLQLAQARLQALVERAFEDGHLEAGERLDITEQLAAVSDHVARIGRSAKEAR